MSHAFELFLEPVKSSEVAQVAIIAVVLLTLLDVCFGVLNALLHREFSSSKMREGIAHKSTSFGFILVADVVDAAIIAGLDLGFAAPVLVFACSYLVLMEIASLLETFCKLNPNLKDTPLFKLFAAAHVEEL